MGIFDFPQKLFKKNTSLSENYLSLVLTSTHVYASVWEFKDQNVHVLGTGEKAFRSLQNLVHETAIAIDKAGQHATSEVSKVVFGIGQSWLKDEQLTKETAKLFKKISKDLELEPQAFIPISAAISHFLRVKRASEKEALLIGIYENFTEINLLRENKVQISKTHASRLSETGISELVKSIKTQSDIPQKIYLFGHNFKHIEEKLEKSLSEILGKKPLIDSFSEKELLLGVSYAQATDILGHPFSLPNSLPVSAETTQQSAELNKNELGFVEGVDIVNLHKSEQIEESTVEEKPQEKSSESNVHPVLHKEKTDEQYAVVSEGEEILAPTHHEPKEKSKGFKFIPSFPSLPNITAIPKQILIAIPVVIIAVLALMYFASPNFVEAEIQLLVSPKTLENDFQVQVVNGSADSDEISGQLVKTIVPGTQKSTATGTKTTGESAKGNVNVLNWTTNLQTFEKDTVIISKSGIKYQLDEQVEVASRSASTPGENKAAVIAAEIGPEGNLSGSNEFTFQQFDELLYSARSEESFTGGEEKQVTIISQEDLDRLEKSLTESLTQKAVEELKKSNSDKKIEDDAIEIEIIKQQFDKDVGEEASLVNLTMEIEASTLTFTEDDLKNFLAQNNQDAADEGFQIRAQDIELHSISAISNKNRITLTGIFKAKQIPNLKEDDLKSTISGKSTKDARVIIKDIPQISDVIFTFSPPIPLVSSLPKNKDKIKISIIAT